MEVNLRNREVQRPIDRTLQEDDEADNSLDAFESHYVSPCRLKVSNDPLTPQDTLCATKIYSCMEGDEIQPDSDEVREILVTYDYDLYYNMRGINYGLTELISYLEGAVLEHLASYLGLKNCDFFSIDDTDNARHRWIEQANEEEAKLNAIVGIGADPVDEIDRLRECTGQGQRACVPMKGKLILYVKDDLLPPDQEPYYKDEIVRIIQSGYTNDVYVSGGVQKLSLIEAENPQQQVSDSPLSLTIIILIAVAGFLFLAILVVLCICFCRRRRDSIDSTAAQAPIVPTTSADFDDHRRWHFRKNKKNSTKSMEGSEVPGSLAATDYLALKPQSRNHHHSGDDNYSVSDAGNTTAMTLTPMKQQRSFSYHSDSSSSLILGEQILQSSIQDVLDDLGELETSLPSTPRSQSSRRNNQNSNYSDSSPDV